jgi:hypothetical protein
LCLFQIVEICNQKNWPGSPRSSKEVNQPNRKYFLIEYSKTTDKLLYKYADIFVLYYGIWNLLVTTLKGDCKVNWFPIFCWLTRNTIHIVWSRSFSNLVHTIMFNIAFVKHWDWCLIQMFHHFFGLSKPISCLSDIVDTNYFWKFWLYVVILILWMIFIHPTWFDVKWNSLIRNNFAPVFHARRYRYRRGLSQK